MEVEDLGGEIASVPSRSFYPAAFGQHSGQSRPSAGVYSRSEVTSSLNPDSFSPYVSFPGSHTAASSRVSFGCNFSSSCYTCKVSTSASFSRGGLNPHPEGILSGHRAEKQDTVGLSRVADRAREFGLYQKYTAPYPFPRIPGYIDVPVAPRGRTRDQARQSPALTVDRYPPWSWSSSWSGQVYCPKEQTQSSQIWKTSLTEDTALPRCESRRVRKKRVPYTKLQLKELEHEYTITKFITKERRRRIASSTSLTERQVTIWFQNRRVKDKKISNKTPRDVEPYQ
ncbi:homeobox protein Hox-D13a [Hoplias malabaricus]|uniref:homeobox protein Hox-D13a n=1 Tax=Hoplias malabaricus TaxID=27720 RepID=UPI003462B866